jgi:WD40 repeat protein
MAVDWLPDGKRVVTASWDNTAKLWDAEQSTVIQTLTGNNSFVIFCTFNSCNI